MTTQNHKHALVQQEITKSWHCAMCGKTQSEIMHEEIIAELQKQTKLLEEIKRAISNEVIYEK